MKEVIYEPKACSKEGSLVKGNVKIRVPNMIERYEYISQVGFKANQDGQLENSSDNLRSIAQMVKLSQPHYLEVNLKHNDGSSIKSFDEMLDNPDCDEIMIEISGMILNGFRPSKN